MKRKLLSYLLTAVTVLFFWQAGFAQTNLIDNGGFETWTDASTPGGAWKKHESVTQETTIVHSGTYSAKHFGDGGTKDINQWIKNIQPGHLYKVTIWYYVASGDGTDARPWCSWIDSNNKYFNDGLDSLHLTSSYLPSNASWQEYTVKVKAPSNAVKMNFEIRTYKNATVYWDDLSMVDITPADNNPPAWTTGFPKASCVEDTHGTFLVNLDKPGKVYFIVVPAGSAAPTAAQVKAGADYGSVSVMAKDTIEVSQANSTVGYTFTGAQPNTSADVWFVAEDNSGNLQSDPVKVSVTTTGARSLTITAPAPNSSFHIGDTIGLKWTSANIDSLIVGVFDINEGLNHVSHISGKIAAAEGSYDIIIPQEAETGVVGLVLWDACDTSFKQVVKPISIVDNRWLKLIAPKDNDTVYVGDTLTFRWTSSNVDSVLIGGYISGDNGPEGGYFMLTGDLDHFDPASFRPIPAAPGVWKMYLDPREVSGSIKLDSIIIWNAANRHIKDYASPVYIQDTFPMRITYSMPAFGMTGFMPTGHFDADFSCDSIVRGTGNLYLKKADGTVVQTFSAADISIHGSHIDFQPMVPLTPGAYYVQIDSGFVQCADGSKTYAGLEANKWTFTVAGSSLYFSEYIEGSHNNKALEIYNPTNADVNLDDYIIAGSFNGSGINYDGDVYHFPKGYVLKAGEVFVLANSQASPDILSHANDTLAYKEGGYVCSFSGNDARVLIKVVNNNGHGGDWMWVDAIGNPWENPGDGWNVAGVSTATKDHTLLRKHSVVIGNGGDWGRSAGTNKDNSEWIVKDKDFFGNIGFPTPVQPKGIAVTFNVDMHYAQNFDPKKDSVILAGNFPGAIWNEPGTNPKLRMSDADSNMIYSLTLHIDTTAMELQYKYFVNAGWGGGEWDGSPNRIVQVSGDTTLNDIFGYADNKLPALELPFSENFDGVTDKAPLALTGWINFNTASGADRLWIGKIYKDNGYAQFSSYKSPSPHGDTAWLITPALNMDNTSDEMLSFDINVGYWKHNGLHVLVSTDFDQTKEGILQATWTDITSDFTIPTQPTSGYGSFAPAGKADLSGYTGVLNVAFVYTGDAASGKTTTYQIDNVKVESTTGIRNPELSDKVEMYPNPGNGQFHIALNGALKGAVSLRIVDITGRIVMVKKFDHVAPTINVDISSQPSNMYFITLSDGHNTIVKKFMKR